MVLKAKPDAADSAPTSSQGGTPTAAAFMVDFGEARARVFRMDILQATKLGPKSQAPKRGGGKRSEKRCSECGDHQNLSAYAIQSFAHLFMNMAKPHQAN